METEKTLIDFIIVYLKCMQNPFKISLQQVTFLGLSYLKHKAANSHISTQFQTQYTCTVSNPNITSFLGFHLPVTQNTRVFPNFIGISSEHLLCVGPDSLCDFFPVGSSHGAPAAVTH